MTGRDFDMILGGERGHVEMWVVTQKGSTFKSSRYISWMLYEYVDTVF